MDKVTENTVKAFFEEKEMKQGNSEITVLHLSKEIIVSYLLHGNLIAQIIKSRNEHYYTLSIEDGGWQTPTTKRRLNAILNFCGGGSVYQKNKIWYFVDRDGNKHSFEDSPCVAHFNGHSGFYVGMFDC